MTPETFQQIIRELAFLYLGILAIALVVIFVLLFRARHLDPLPLLPLTGLICTSCVGTRITLIWFGLQYQTVNAFDFQFWWAEIMNPLVLKPLTTIICGLMFHCLIYAFAELRFSKKRKRLSPSTRIVFHGQLLIIFLSVLIHYKVFDYCILEQARSHGIAEREIYMWQEEEGAKTKIWRMLFIPTEYPDWDR